MDLHPAVAHLAPLLGTWRGAGRGHYPTIDPFEYTEEVTFGHVGKPFLAYNQRTKGADGAPLHAECGYWRPAGERGLELLIVHPSGIAEILVGEVMETHFGLVVMLAAGAADEVEASGAGGADAAASGAGGADAAASGAGGADAAASGAGGADAAASGAGGADAAASGAGGADAAASGAGGTATPGTAGVRTGANGSRVVLAPTAKRVDATERRFSVDGDTMRYEVHMAAVGEPMTHHLEATLHRSD